jgi:hypothetical protein
MKIFLSSVSGQFKACRDALASDLRAVGADVTVQEDFQQSGRSLLEKLEHYVAGCDRIIALVGDAYGWEPEEAARPPGRPRRSYTQWEYFFARGERLDGSTQPARDIFVYFAAPAFLAEHTVNQTPEAADLQRAFVDEVRRSGKDWNQFGSLHELRALVLRDGFRLAGAATRGGGDETEILPFLCDRQEHEDELRDWMLGHASRRGARPLLGVIYGEADEGHRPFLRRVEEFTLPRRWRGLLPKAGAREPETKFIHLPSEFTPASPAAFARQFRQRLRDRLYLPMECAETDAALLAALAKLGWGLLAISLILASSEAEKDRLGPTELLDLLRGYWRDFPDTSGGPLIVCFVLAKLAGRKNAPASGGVRGLFRWLAPKAARAADEPLRARIEQWKPHPDEDAQIPCRVMPELRPARPEHVEDWSELDVVRNVLPVLDPYDIQKLFQENNVTRPEIPMDEMHRKLRGLIAPDSK